MIRAGCITIACILLLPAYAWRSDLYPDTWIPPESASFASDKLLQDFSYAGYRRGEVPPPTVGGPVFDAVETFGADPSGTEDSTATIQAALDAAGAAGGGVVILQAGTYHVQPVGGNDYALLIRNSGVVLRGAGAGETFLLNTSHLMRNKSIVQIVSPSVTSFSPILITADLPNPTRRLPVANASVFQPGDIVQIQWTFTQDWIDEHGQASFWTAPGNVPDDARAYREVIAVDENAGWIEVDIPTRYTIKTRDNARIHKIAGLLSESGIEDLSIGNVQHPGNEWGSGDYSTPGTAAYDVHGSFAITVDKAMDCWIRNVESYQATGNSSTCHILSNGILINESFRVTIADCAMRRSQYGGGGGNGYMYRVRQSQENLIRDSVADFSRHGFVLSHAGSSGNVFLRCEDRNTARSTGASGSYQTTGAGSDHHMHFSHSNLFDQCTVYNSFFTAAHRGNSGTIAHGLAAAHSVYWNTTGSGGGIGTIVESEQGRYGYVIGTRGSRQGVVTPTGNGTAPTDHVEGVGLGETLEPQSLYQDQFSKRMQRFRIFLEPEATLATTSAYPLNPTVFSYSAEALTAAWRQVDGPPATFSDPSSLETTVSLPTVGTYILRLTVTNGSQTHSRDITLTVVDNTAPQVSAGDNLTTRLEGGKLWTPKAIPTAAWYDAADTDTITADNGAVLQWKDKSGNARHLTQITGPEQPLTSTRTLNTRNVLEFDGSDDFMSNDGIGAGISSLFIVFFPDQTITYASNNQWLTSTVDDSVTSGLVLGASTAALDGEILSLLDENEPNRYIDRQGVSNWELGDLEPAGHLTSSVLDTDWFIGMNGSNDLRDLTSGTRNALTYTSSFGIGASLRRQSDRMGYFDGGIAEILCLPSTVDSATRQTIEGYLGHKWGLTDRFPSNHPYKNSPPEGSTATVTLDGRVQDAEEQDLEISWIQMSGPAFVSFGTPNAVTTTALFSQSGEYVLRLMADDGYATTTDHITVKVLQPFVDRDADGMADDWETEHFPGREDEIDGSGDADSDGLLDYFEFIFGSNPNDPTSFGAPFEVIKDSAGPGPVITWEVQEGMHTGTHYEIRKSTDFLTWNPLNAETYTLTETTTGGFTRLELRIHSLPPAAPVFIRLQRPSQP